MNDQVKNISEEQYKILKYTKQPRKRKDILENCLGLANHTDNFRKHVEPLLNTGLLVMTIPDKPKRQNQMYIITKNGEKILTGN